MKKTLLLIAASAALGTANADVIKRNDTKQLPDRSYRVQHFDTSKAHHLEAAPAADMFKAPALDAPTVDPTIYAETIEDWYMFFTEYTDLFGQRVYFENENTVYFGDLSPYCFQDAMIKGVRNGNDITIELPIAFTVHGESYYVTLADYDEAEEEFYPKEGNYHFTIDGDEIYSTDPDAVYAVYFDYYGEGDYMMWGADRNLRMTKYNAPVVKLPEGVATTTYSTSFIDNYGYPVFSLNEVAMVGNDLYVKGLMPGASEAWQKGKIEGDKVTVFADQFLGVILGELLYGSFGQYNEDGDVDYRGEDLVLDYDVTQGTLSAPGTVLMSLTLQMLAEGMGSDVFLKPYIGVSAGKPVAPTFLERWGDNVFDFYLSCGDVDGNYLEPANLSWKVYCNDQEYVFTPGTYYMLEEEMVEVPYFFYDNYDFFASGDGMIEFNLYQPLCLTLDFQAINTVDGVKMYSDKMRYHFDSGETEIIEVENDNPVELNAVRAGASAHQIFDLMGRKTSAQSKGLQIVKSVMSDGSIKVIKRLND